MIAYVPLAPASFILSPLNRSSVLCRSRHHFRCFPAAFSSAWIKRRSRSFFQAPNGSQAQHVILMTLSVTTEPLPNSQVALDITVTEEECSAAWNKVLRKLGKDVKVDGFRKGRVPRQILINVVGRDNIKADACQELIESSVQKSLKEQNIRAIGQAQFEDDESAQRMMQRFEPNQGLTFRIRIDVWPEVKFKGPYEGLEIEATDVPVDEELVDRSLEELRKRESFTVVAPEGSVAQLGQVAISTLVGYYQKEDGTKGDRLPDIAEGKNIEVSLQERQYMPGFIEGMLGMKVGETRTIAVKFPEQSAKEELRGVSALFDVTVNALKNRVLPELNDEFAKEATESETLEDLRKVIRARLGVESEKAAASNVETAIEDAIVEITETALPETLVENQIKSKFATMMTEFKSKGMSDEQVKKMITKDNYELYKKTSDKTVRRRLTVNLAFAKIADEQGLISDEKEMEDQMEAIRAELKGEEVDEDRLREHVQAQLEREKVLRYLKKSCRIIMVPPKDEEKSDEHACAPTEKAAVGG